MLLALARDSARWLFFLAIPFAMFAWLLPFVAGTTIGNDYPIFGPSQQTELMWSAWNGTFPLYMPGFAGGHSTAAMTLGQLYHPLSWLSSAMPRYQDGQALEWNTCFRLLSLGVAHALLFKLCHRLGLKALLAFLVTFPVIYNLRMLDSFRYGASLEAYVGMVLAATAIGFLYLDSVRKRPVVLLGACIYMLIVSGHPQWAFYGSVGVGLFALLFPWLAVALNPELEAPAKASLVRYAKRLTIGFATGLLLASPYLLTFYFEYFSTNRSRLENSYTWTLFNSDSVLGELCNFLLPFHADVHGAFGGSALFLVAALFPISALLRRPPKVLWIAYGLGLLVFLFAVGKASWPHPLLVKNLPLLGAFRTPGRLVLLLPLLAFPIWAWLVRESNRTGLAAACTLAVILCVSHGLWMQDWLPVEERYTPHGIVARGLPRGLDMIVLGLSGATVLLLGCAAAQGRFLRSLVVLSTLTMVATTWLCLRFGTWREAKRPAQSFAQIAEARRRSVLTTIDPGSGMEMGSLTEYFRRRLGPEAALGVIRHRIEQAPSDGEALQRLQEATQYPPLFINSPVVPLSRELVLARDRVDLIHNTSNRFVFEVAAAADGYFVLGLPWLPGFVAKLDGARVAIVRANALTPAVFVPRGLHHIDFCFVSWAFLAGAALAFLTVLAWALYGFRGHRVRVAAAAILSAALLAWLLQRAVLAGPSFATEYHWDAEAEAWPSHQAADVAPSR